MYHKGKFNRGFLKNYFEDFEEMMTTHYARFENREKIREFKKNLTNLAEEQLMPLKINVSPIFEEPTAFYMSKYVFNCSPDFARFLEKEGKMELLIKVLSKFPNRSSTVHSRWISAIVYNNEYCLNNYIGDLKTVFEKLKKYIDGKITYEEVMKNFSSPYSDLEGGGLWSGGAFSGGREVGTYCPVRDLSLYKEALKSISKRLLKEAKNMYTPSIRKGTRINRDYVLGMSYKPLLEKSVVSHKKTKIMVVHDCSGSMDKCSLKAVSYIGALVNSGVVDVTHAVYHSEYGWKDMKEELSKGKIAHYSGGDEGFKYLDDNLPSEWVKEVDFIVVTTDLRYDTDQQEGLYEYVKKANKHLILSFQDEGTLKDLNVRKVDTVQDMVNATVTLVR